MQPYTEGLAVPRLRTAIARSAEPVGEVRMEPGVAMFCGPAGDIHSHSHSAMQLALSLGGELQVRDRSGLSTVASGFIIPSCVPHRIDATDGACVMLVYIEPHSHTGRRLMTRFECVSAMSQPLSAHDVTECVAAIDEALNMYDYIDGLLSGASPNVHAHGALRSGVDTRVAQVMRHCRNGLDDDKSIEELAMSLSISSRYLRKLFEREVGMPVQRFRLWEKLRLAIECIVRGENLTTAAHTARFCDLAHFSRTFRAMFGMSPSCMLNVPLTFDRAPSSNGSDVPWPRISR